MIQSTAWEGFKAQVLAFFESQSPSYLWGTILLISTAVYFLYWAADRTYMLYFHPLARFPGPEEACLSQKWLLRVSEDGNPEHVFEKLHEKHNSRAIRIAPNELHIDDVNVYKTVYSQTSPYTKYPGFYDGFNTPHTVFAEHVPSLHKVRRRILNPFFSRRAINQIEPLLKGKIAELGRRIDSQSGPCNIFNAIRCTTVDIISHYCTGKPLGQLQKSDQNFYGGFLESFDSLSNILWRFMYQPAFRQIVTTLPTAVVKATSKDTRTMLSLYDACYDAAVAYKKSPPNSEYPIVFSTLSDLPEEEMGAEATDLLVAGSDTTAYTLAIAIVQISRNAYITEKLFQALESGVASAEQLPTLVNLEKIEYLSACAREAVRFAIASPGRLPRVVPKDAKPLVVGGQVIPAGTVVGMSAYTMNFSKELWGDDAATFNPDRWLGENGKSLDANMCSFSKGLRTCIGQNLAYAEIHFILAYLFRKYEVTLVDKEAKVETHDRFTSYVASHAIMVNLRRRRD
ncbi:cytochrome P450 [Dactylonectria estremocensis]|uniref:Cytochrome P450 n=1 Tax=Dactylonectria estremocensis TaxID=1079267 RepID=A0A9P9J665_9HYPO|nr:cytochrome P450 [Dactylonectria estremocensis]